MSEHKTLLQFLLDLLHDKQAQADFQDHPQQALHEAGLDHVCVQDIQDLLPVVLEKADPEQCAKYEDDCDKGDCHVDTPKHHGHHHDGHHWDHDSGWDDDHQRDGHHHDSEIDKVITHLNYVTNNYSFDSHDTIYNTNNITKVWADHGAKVDVTNDTHNVGAGGVSIEGDNNAPVATGGHNQIGHDNQQSGDGSTTAFGAGSALSHVGTGDGGAINTGAGSASGNAEHANFQNFGDGNLTASTHAPATASNVDSHDDNSVSHSNNSTDNSHGSHNTDNSVNTDASTNDSNNPHTESTTDHSFNTETDNSADNSTNVDHGHIDNGLLLH
jgi:hypothetical protein